MKNKNQKLIEGPGNEQQSERVGQPLGPPGIKAPLTQVGVSAEISNGNPIGVYRGKIVSGATGRPIVIGGAEDGRKCQEISRSQYHRKGPATDGPTDAGLPKFGQRDAAG